VRSEIIDSSGLIITSADPSLPSHQTSPAPPPPATHTTHARPRTCSALMWMPGLSFRAASAATVLFELPMCQLRKRNWRDRLDFSMTSSSVTVTTPPSPGVTLGLR
jgi:hypothetical protein